MTDEKTFEELRKIVENLDSARANYLYGYLKGFHNIQGDVDKQRVREAIRNMRLVYFKSSFSVDAEATKQLLLEKLSLED